MENSKRRDFIKTVGPGLLFASTAIGTSHLVLSTRAGAHHGLIFILIIVGTLLLKYPFYEFGPRYVAATGNSLIKGYKHQGDWAVYLFLAVISINMFAVTGAIAAVSAGLLSTMIGIKASIPHLVGIVIGVTVLILLIGGYSFLDIFIKVLSIILLITVSIAFTAVLMNGPIVKNPDFIAPKLLEGTGLALLVSLIGWMPAGMEASTMHSIWVVEKMKDTNYKPSLSESLFDFNLGFIFTTILALMFLTIGAFTVFGSGLLLEGNATQFSNQLLQIFVSNLGNWSYWIIAIAAFGTIYGTLITVLDAFTRSFIRGILVLYNDNKSEQEKNKLLQRNYKILLPILGLGAFALFYFSAASMLKILQLATIIAFLTSPIIAFLNVKAINSKEVSLEYKPPSVLIILAYFGLIASILFSLYYVYTLF